MYYYSSWLMHRGTTALASILICMLFRVTLLCMYLITCWIIVCCCCCRVTIWRWWVFHARILYTSDYV